MMLPPLRQKNLALTSEHFKEHEERVFTSQPLVVHVQAPSCIKWYVRPSQDHQLWQWQPRTMSTTATSTPALPCPRDVRCNRMQRMHHVLRVRVRRR